MTSRAELGFHAAYDFGINGRTFTNREAYSMYPTPVQRSPRPGTETPLPTSRWRAGSTGWLGMPGCWRLPEAKTVELTHRDRGTLRWRMAAHLLTIP